MPLIFVSRYAIEEAIIAGGTQYVEGALSFASGTQFVDGNLTLTNGTQIYLSSTLYATAGTYDLFTITGNLIGTTLDGSNYLTGVQILPLKAGRAVVGGYAFWNAGAKKVQVTLV